MNYYNLINVTYFGVGTLVLFFLFQVYCLTLASDLGLTTIVLFPYGASMYIQI